jgi:hypothetical protein
MKSQLASFGLHRDFKIDLVSYATIFVKIFKEPDETGVDLRSDGEREE